MFLKQLKKQLFFIQITLCWSFTLPALAQWDLPEEDSVGMLLTSVTLQVQITQAVDYMYNFEFQKAESLFGFIKESYKDHPLPYFLMGLSNWWKIMPDTDNEAFDKPFFAYMDSTILMAEKRYKNHPDSSKRKLEAAFFLSGANAFIGRLYSERKSWTQAAIFGKRALNYLEFCKGKGELSPELLFGDGLFNYYSEWIRENYKYLRPIMWFFPKGDKELGLNQLKTVVKDAFYARIEAQYFLMRIYAFEENQHQEALRIGKYLHESYPNNPYFHRNYARMLYTNGQFVLMKSECLEILERIAEGMIGYENTAGRYAGFFLGTYFMRVEKDYPQASEYFHKAILYSEKGKDTEAGFYLHSLAGMGKIKKYQNDYDSAMHFYEQVLDHADRNHSSFKEAKKFKKEFKKYRKNN